MNELSSPTTTNYVQTTPFTEQDYTNMIYKQKEEIQQLKKENAELDSANTRLRESNFYLQKELTTLKQQLSEIKYLGRDEVIKEYSFYLGSLIEISIDDNDKKDYKICLKKFITAICNLALKIDRDKLIQQLCKSLNLEIDIDGYY